MVAGARTLLRRAAWVVVAVLVMAPPWMAAAWTASRPPVGQLLGRASSSTKLRCSPIDHEYFNRPGPWDEKDMPSLLGANKRWSQRVAVEKPGFFDELKRGHAPKILWIGCSDARVPANEIIGEPPGSVFVHRNIANQVISTDFNCMSVIQYAVSVLKVKHIIVCGHYDCGGVRAATVLLDHRSPLENWLRHIRDIYRLHRTELDGIKSTEDRRRRLVELNVIEQCMNVFKTSVVQKSRMESNAAIGQPDSKVTFLEPRVHAMVYDPTTGVLNKLDVDFKEHIFALRGVYELYRLEPEAGATEKDPDIVKSILES